MRWAESEEKQLKFLHKGATMRKRVLISVIATSLFIIVLGGFIGKLVYNKIARFEKPEDAFTNIITLRHSELLKLFVSEDVALAINRKDSIYSLYYLEKDNKGWKIPSKTIGKSIYEKQLGNYSLQIENVNDKLIIVIDSLNDTLEKPEIYDSVASNFQFYQIDGLVQDTNFYYQVWFTTVDKKINNYTLTLNDEIISITV